MKLVASRPPASAAVAGPYSRRPRRSVSATVPSAASADGSRAVSGVTSPAGSENSAISQKNSGGLSVVTTPLTCGTAQRPSTTISRAPSAK